MINGNATDVAAFEKLQGELTIQEGNYKKQRQSWKKPKIHLPTPKTAFESREREHYRVKMKQPWNSTYRLRKVYEGGRYWTWRSEEVERARQVSMVKEGITDTFSAQNKVKELESQNSQLQVDSNAQKK